MVTQIHELAIGIVIFIDEHSHEFIPKEGEISKEDVDGYFTFLEAHHKLPVKVLLNRRNSYSYSFLAQQSLYKNMTKPVIAVINASNTGKKAFEALAMLAKDWNYAFFESREEALDWLKSQV